MPTYPTPPSFQPDLEAQLNVMSELTRKSSVAIRKLSELNLEFAQQLMQDAFDASGRLLACTSPTQWATAFSSAAQPAIEHTQQYQQKLVGLLNGAQLDLSRDIGVVPPSTRAAMGGNSVRSPARTQ